MTVWPVHAFTGPRGKTMELWKGALAQTKILNVSAKQYSVLDALPKINRRDYQLFRVLNMLHFKSKIDNRYTPKVNDIYI
jgi:hypothetical protein